MDVQSLFSVKGKIALITGGSRGLGLAMAEAFVTNGAKVYISSRKASECESAVKTLDKIVPGQAKALPADVSTEAGCKKLVEDFKKHENKLHFLINNAGATWGADFFSYPDEAWDKINSINVKAIFFMTRECHGLLKVAGTPEDPARIINTSSVAGLGVTEAWVIAYSASKSAVNQITKILARHLGNDNIAVNAIAPGMFPTKMSQGIIEMTGERYKDSTVFKRYGLPSDIAGVVLYLCSKASAYVTGVVIPVDGGSLVATANL
jgi:NAD(P)-dependent dehydrogenase (short-subunit alcohol dehydrogenase family)